MTQTLPPPTAHPVAPAWTAETIQAKLLDRLEAGFGRHYQLADKAPSNTLYLAILLRTHFRIESHVAHELAHYCTTIQDLVHQLTGLLVPDLFSTPAPSPTAAPSV